MYAVLLRGPGRSEIAAQTGCTAAAFLALATGKSGESQGAVSVVMVDSDLLHELDDASLEHRVLDPHEGLGERESVRRGEKVGHIGRGRGRFRRLGCTRYARRAFEEERHRDLQDVGDLLQSARADAVRALLVFLDLLKRQAKCAAEIRLAHCQHHPAHAHPAADVLVDGIWGLLADGIHYRFRIEKIYPRSYRDERAAQQTLREIRRIARRNDCNVPSKAK